MKKYQPSNGTEGMYFTEKYCMNCLHCDPNPEGKKQCEILCRTLVFDVSDKEYPAEWIYDENDQGICTKWQKWDWGNDGDPGNRDNPKAPMPDDPNQLCMPFIIEEIECNTIYKKQTEDEEISYRTIRQTISDSD